VHPVIVRKRALPVVSLTSEVAAMIGVVNRMGMVEVFAY